jgi:uncharacterized protein YukE
MTRAGRTAFALCLASLIVTVLSARAAQPARVRSSAAQTAAARATTLTPAQEAYIRRTLTPAQRNQLASMGRTLARSPSYSAIRGPWTQFIRAAAATGKPMDINALVAQVSRESYLQNQALLKDYAEKVEHYNKLKNQLRQDQERLRSQHARAGSTSVQVQRAPAGSSAPAAESATAPTAVIKARPQVAPTEEDRLNEQLAAADANLHSAQADFENFNQKTNQFYNMLSTVMKAMREEATAVVRNTR